LHHWQEGLLDESRPFLSQGGRLFNAVIKMRLLLIEDDQKMALFVKTGLKETGFAVDHAIDGEDGMHLALTEPYDMAVVDLMLPTVNGLSIIKTMREQQIQTPVIILSAKRSVDDRVEGLQTGGDDYLVKPFAFSELIARIQALMRRYSCAAAPSELRVADLSLNVQTQKVARAGQKINLQPLEFSLLEYLMRNSGRVVTKTMIMEHVWDYNFNPRTNVVEARVCCLREKVDKGFDLKLIHTVRGVGYVCEER
jgi:two-component system OmpR family response regulator